MISKDQIDSLTCLFQSYYGYVTGVALRYAPSKDCVDDIVQKVYLDFVVAAGEKNLDLSKDIGPFLYQITKRKSQMIWRGRQRRKTTPIEEVMEELSTTLSDSEDHDLLCEKLHALNSCLAKMAPKSRAIVEQHYFDGVSMKKVGEQQNMKPAAIHQFFCRVRLALRECIEKTLGK